MCEKCIEAWGNRRIKGRKIGGGVERRLEEREEQEYKKQKGERAEKALSIIRGKKREETTEEEEETRSKKMKQEEEIMEWGKEDKIIYAESAKYGVRSTRK